MSTIFASHIAEKGSGGGWNVSRLDDRTHSTSGRDRGWHFIAAADGNPRYMLRMEEGSMVARTVKTVPVTTEWGERIIRVGSTTTLIHDDLPEGGQVLIVGRRCGRLTWFGGCPTYDGSNIDGGVIYKTYVSSQHRRKGVATAMLGYARNLYPQKDIRHSNALSDDGAAFAAATPTPNDLRDGKAVAA